MLLVTLLALASVQTAEATPPASIMTITVQKLPKDFKTDPVISLTFNEKGAVVTCATAKTSGSAGIDRVACNQVKGNVTEPVEAGAVPAARDATVTFVQEAPKG